MRARGAQECVVGFNTTLVQLKAQTHAICQVPQSQFQYHSGPIKRSHLLSALHSWHKFQYHSGPIKSGVHLLETIAGPPFQYHSGPIKSSRPAQYSRARTRFNTTLVQLKAGDQPRRGFFFPPGFNTTLVQLKVVFLSHIRTSLSFQYHSGPIKSEELALQVVGIALVSIPLWSN